MVRETVHMKELPDRWAIRITEENWIILEDFFNRGYTFENLINSYINVYRFIEFNHYGSKLETIEITTEQFKQFVLNIPPKAEFEDYKYLTKFLKKLNVK